MKQKTESRAILLLVLLVISFSKSSARFLKPRQGDEEPILHFEDLIAGMKRSEDIGLLKMKDCNGGGEEYCSERRMIVEAHLDYVYTQHLKP